MINRKLLMTIIAVGISTFATTSASAATQSKRLWGKDRYETGAAIVQQGWQSSSNYAIIVNGENFPDALSAAPLAKKFNAPILLTQDSTLDSNTLNQLKRLNVKNVIIVGGEGVVTPKVEKDINDLGIQISRYKGQDRDETSLNVASQIGTENGVIVAVDNDYTDALSAAPIAANLQMPIILVSKNTVNDNLKKFISKNYITKTYVLGDSDIISDTVSDMFPNVQRITGRDKYERNINIIKAFEDKVDFNNVCVAYSEKFADALTGSAFAAANKNPIILVGDQLEDCTNNFIKDKKDSIDNFTILGGTAGINDNLVSKLTGGDSSNDGTSQTSDEKEGNTFGNLRNGGFVVEKDGWVYYIKNGTKICAAKTNGTEEIKIADVKNARSINVVGNNIYYVAATDSSSNHYDDSVSIFKASTNGASKSVLISVGEENFGQAYPCMQIDGHWACYSPNLKYISKENSSFYEGFYRVDTNNREDKLTAFDYYRSMIVKNGFVYYTTLRDNTIRKMPTAGNKKSDGTVDDRKELDLGIKGDLKDIVNGYIYYVSTDGDTYKVKENGSERKKITSLPEKFIINGEWIYYVVPGEDNLYELRKMKEDGSQDTGLNAYKINDFAITGDWIYYRNSGNGNMYRMKLDGSYKEQFPEKVGIESINDVNVSIKKGEKYKLPRAVQCEMEDGSNQYFTVNWSKNSVDTNNRGVFEFEGTVNVNGASHSVKLKLDIS